MEESQNLSERITKPLVSYQNPGKLLLIVIIASVVLGVTTGYIVSQKGVPKGASPIVGAPKNPQQDQGTFRDFAQGTIKAKPQPSNTAEYTEGTHILEREGAVPVALTSSVVDLSQYEGKKVKVYGETQKALKEGWLMDVGKVEEIK